MVLKLQDLFRIMYDTYEGWKAKATINNKVRTIEQIRVLDPVRKNILVLTISIYMNQDVFFFKLIKIHACEQKAKT